MITGANAAGFDPRDEGNWRCGESADGACINPSPDVPSIPREFRRGFILFQCMFNQMPIDGMTGQRRIVPTSDVESEARIRGIKLTEWDLDVFRACEIALAGNGKSEED